MGMAVPVGKATPLSITVPVGEGNALQERMGAFNGDAPRNPMFSAEKLASFHSRTIHFYNGDCREVLRNLPAESCDFVLTDPPYIVSYEGRWGSRLRSIRGDSETDWLVPAFVEIWRVLKENSLCLSFYGWPNADLFLSAWKLIGFRPVSQLVCVKDNIGLGYFTRNQHETAYLLAKGNPPRPGAAQSDVFSWERESALFHPNQKPLSTIARMIAAYSQEGDVVLDPFMGSGTTLVAAKNLGRQAIGIEIEPEYCDVASARLAQELFNFEGETRKADPHQNLLLSLCSEEE